MDSNIAEIPYQDVIDQQNDSLAVIGWREWVRLPELGINRIKAKIDTGAKSSSLHAYDIEVYENEGEQFVRFKIHPAQQRLTLVVEAQSKVHEFREVRSSNGQTTNRPVIRTAVEIFGRPYEIDVTLFDRTKMGFRMLIGREAMRDRFMVDPRISYCGGVPAKRKKRR